MLQNIWARFILCKIYHKRITDNDTRVQDVQ